MLNFKHDTFFPFIGNASIAEHLATFERQYLDPVKSVARENSQSKRNIQLLRKNYFGHFAKERNRYRRFLRGD